MEALQNECLFCLSSWGMNRSGNKEIAREPLSIKIPGRNQGLLLYLPQSLYSIAYIGSTCCCFVFKSFRNISEAKNNHPTLKMKNDRRFIYKVWHSLTPRRGNHNTQVKHCLEKFHKNRPMVSIFVIWSSVPTISRLALTVYNSIK